MFKIILLRPVLCNFIRPFSLAATQIPVGPNFGDSRMPDKLYKMIELEMKGAEPAVLKSYETFIKSVAEHLGIEMGKNWRLDKPLRQRWDLLKSVHIYRKHIVQYEVRTHYTWMQLHKLTGSTADTFLEYIERMLPEGVALKVTKVSIEPMPLHLSEEIELRVRKQSGEVKEGNIKHSSIVESSKVNQLELEAEDSKEEDIKQLSSFEDVEVQQPELEAEVSKKEDIKQLSSFEDVEVKQPELEAEDSKKEDIKQLSSFEDVEVKQPELEAEDSKKEDIKQLSSFEDMEVQQPELEAEDSKEEDIEQLSSLKSAEVKELKTEEVKKENVTDNV